MEQAKKCVQMTHKSATLSLTGDVVYCFFVRACVGDSDLKKLEEGLLSDFNPFSDHKNILFGDEW